MATRTQKRFNKKVRFAYVPENLTDARNEIYRPYMVPNINRSMPTLKRRRAYNGKYQLYAGISDKVCKQNKRDPTPLFEPFKDPNVLNRNFTYNKARMMEVGHIERNPKYNIGAYQATQPIVTKRGVGMGYSNAGAVNGFQTNWRPPIKTRQDITGIVMPTEYNVGAAAVRKGSFTAYLAPKYNLKAQRKRLDAIYGTGVRKDIFPSINGLNVQNTSEGQVCLKPERKRVTSGSVILDRAIDIGNAAKGLIQRKEVPWIVSQRTTQITAPSYAVPQVDYIQTAESKRKITLTRSGEYISEYHGPTVNGQRGNLIIQPGSVVYTPEMSQPTGKSIFRMLGDLFIKDTSENYGSVMGTAQGIAQDPARLSQKVDTKIKEGQEGVMPQVITSLNNGLQSLAKLVKMTGKTVSTPMSQPLTGELKANLPQSGIVKSHPHKGILKNNVLPNQVGQEHNQIPKSETPYYKKIIGTTMSRPIFPAPDSALHYGYNNKIIFGEDSRRNRKILYGASATQNKKMY